MESDILALVGFMGAGKTCIGRLVADLLGWSFTDTDSEIVRSQGRSIARIFADDGESRFREIEAEIVRRAVAGRRRVVALGGGAVAWGDTLERLLRSSMVVYLRATPDTLRARLASEDDSERPFLVGGEFPEDLLARRVPIYEKADIIIDTDGRTPAEVAEAVRARVRAERGEA